MPVLPRSVIDGMMKMLWESVSDGSRMVSILKPLTCKES